MFSTALYVPVGGADKTARVACSRVSDTAGKVTIISSERPVDDEVPQVLTGSPDLQFARLSG